MNELMDYSQAGFLRIEMEWIYLFDREGEGG